LTDLGRYHQYRTPDNEDTMTPTVELESILIFSVASIRFCVSIQQIESVLDYQPLSNLPNEPTSIAGNFWYQGNFTQVINVRNKFGLAPAKEEQLAASSLIITQIDEKFFAFGVDRIEDISNADKFDWQKLPTLNTGIFNHALLQHENIILEVDLEKLYRSPTLNVAEFIKFISNTALINKQAKSSNPVKARIDTRQKPKSESRIQNLTNITRTTAGKTSSNQTAALPKDNKPLTPNIDLQKEKDKPVAGNQITPIKIATPEQLQKQPVTQTKEPIQHHVKNTVENDNIIPTQIENIFKKDNNVNSTTNTNPDNINNIVSKNINKQFQSSYKKTSAIKQEESPLNIAPFFLLATIAAALLYFTFGSYFETGSSLEKRSSGNGQTESAKIVIKNRPQDKPVSEKTIAEPVQKPITQQKIIESTQLTVEPLFEPPFAVQPRKIITEKIIETENIQIIIKRQSQNQIGKSNVIITGGNILLIHTVIKGDTLWYIAKHYLNNPYLYPELAKLSEIKNSDLIYPGDTIIIKKRVKPKRKPKPKPKTDLDKSDRSLTSNIRQIIRNG